MRHAADRRLMRAALLASALSGLLGAGCAAPPVTTSTEAISAMIGDAACNDRSQCRVIGIGSRPCGGPRSHLAWSTKVTDAERLRAAVAAQAEAEAAENQKRGMASICMLAPEPTVACRPRAGQPDGAARACQLEPR